MNLTEQLIRLRDGLERLGSGRLLSLVFLIVMIAGIVIWAGWYLSRPDFDLLYAGLDREDVSRISSALQEDGIAFDVSADGTSVYAARGRAASARMRLAEKGLPRGGTSGYELFDKVGSFGLTSFMQNVTRIRALEGELARTIQTMRGVKHARVHVVLPEDGGFRRTPQPATASVVIRGELLEGVRSAMSIRHLVASAVGGMSIDQVTVMDTDGTLLASGEDKAQAAPGRLLALEQSVSSSLQDKIKSTLAPYLNPQNMQVSVVARLNTDQHETKEVTYNPEGKVERSVRVIKENQTAQNQTGQTGTSAERNIPQDPAKAADSKKSNEENQKREETTNYEISSKTTTTTSGGYALERLSIAVLINRQALAAAEGGKADEAAIDRKLKDIEQLVVSASGIRKERGDSLKITAVDFSAVADAGADAMPAWMDMLLHQVGTLIKSVTTVVIVLIALSVLRPMVRKYLDHVPAAGMAAETGDMGSFPMAMSMDDGGMGPMALSSGMSDADLDALLSGKANEDNIEDFLNDISNREKHSPQKRLTHMVDFNEERAAAVLKRWIHQGSMT